jgi:energy-coupling factor transporter transmembrane protein EcfT
VSLERVDARVKLYMLLAMSTASVAAREPGLLALLLTETAAVLLIGGVSVGRALWRIRGALGLVLSVFVLQCIFNRSGAPLITLGGFTLVTRGGVVTALCVMLRLWIILLAALIILTGESRDYLLALGQLGLPYEISFMVMAGMRFLPLLRDEAQDVLCAVQMRGTQIKGAGLRKRLRVYLSIAVPIVAGAIRRSEQMSIAMEARAFRSLPRRTVMRTRKMRRADWLWLIAFTAALAAIVVLCTVI